MASRKSKKKKVFSDINITPLTDIFLVLLIIMMVVAPSFQSDDSALTMPQITSGSAVKEDKATVSVTKEGDLYVNGEQVAAEFLSDKLKEIKPEEEASKVLVKADKDAKSADILLVMRAAKEAGFEKLTVAGEPLTVSEKKSLEQEQTIEPEVNKTDDAEETAEWKE